jgi:hypothetical protein
VIKPRVHYRAIPLLLAIFPLLVFSSCNRSIGDANAASDVPIHIHLTWQNSDMSTSITVTWQTTNATSGDAVKYDNASRNGDPPSYAHSAIGAHHTYSGATGWIHDVELFGLSQNTTYYFVCGGNIGGYSNERKFKTAPTNFSHLRFVAGGDSRDNPTERDRVSNAMRQFNPSFVLYVGDAVASGSSQSLWDGWFASMDSIWVDSNDYTIPIIPCLGNHEANATNWYKQFALPGNEQWYSLDWGNNVHIIVLNTETTLSGSQKTWLHNDLEAHKNVPWKFAMFHEPAFSSGSSHGSDTGVQQYWVPEFDKYHVNIIFAGHDHDYERSKPINYTKSNNSPQPSYNNASMYVVSGGWGAPLTSAGSNWWTIYSSSVYNFVLVDVFANGTLSLQAKDDSGLTFDVVQSTFVPEFPSLIILPIFMATNLITAYIIRKRRFRAKPL